MKMKMKLHILINLWCWFHLIRPNYCARILGIYPIIATSHFNFHAEIMRALADAGHQVTMISPFLPSRPHQNLTIINSQIGREIDMDSMLGAINTQTYWFTNILHGINGWVGPDCRHVLSMEEVKNLKNYDIMFLELIPLYKCYLPLARKLNISVVGTSAMRSTYDSDISMGNSRNSAIVPKEYTFVNAKMSFYERLINFLEEIPFYALNFIGCRKIKKIHDELHESGDPNPQPVSLLFSNTHEIFLSQAETTNVIHIGGIGVKSATLNPLPKDLEDFINEADHGVILFSFGTLALGYALPQDVLDMIRITFTKIKQRVIWKCDYDLGRISDNILQVKWVPQKEVLANDKVVAFISHGGLNSINEAIYFGKPMVLLPLFGDQPGNVAILSSFDVCICLNLMKLNEIILMDALAEITDNPKYRKNMQRLSQKFKDDPMSPKEKVVYWTEYVLRHKGAHHLRWVGADMSSYQYFLIDVIGFVIIAFLFAIFFLYLSFKRISALLGRYSLF